MAGLTRHFFDLTVDLRIVNFDFVIVDLVFFVQFDREFRRQSNIKLKLKVVLVLYVLRCLRLIAHRLAQHFQFLFFNVAKQFVGKQFVYFLHLYLRTIHLIHQAERHLSRTESRHVRLLAHFFQCLIDLLCIISLDELNRNRTTDRSGLFKWNVHRIIFYLLFLLSYSKGHLSPTI